MKTRKVSRYSVIHACYNCRTHLSEVDRKCSDGICPHCGQICGGSEVTCFSEPQRTTRHQVRILGLWFTYRTEVTP